MFEKAIGSGIFFTFIDANVDKVIHITDYICTLLIIYIYILLDFLLHK